MILGRLVGADAARFMIASDEAGGELHQAVLLAERAIAREIPSGTHIGWRKLTWAAELTVEVSVDLP